MPSKAVQIASGALEKAKAARGASAAKNRALAPLMSAWIDEMRAAFPDLRVTFISEGGNEGGERGPEGVEATVPPARPQKKDKEWTTRTSPSSRTAQ